MLKSVNHLVEVSYHQLKNPIDDGVIGLMGNDQDGLTSYGCRTREGLIRSTTIKTPELGNEGIHAVLKDLEANTNLKVAKVKSIKVFDVFVNLVCVFKRPEDNIRLEREAYRRGSATKSHANDETKRKENES